MQDLDEYEYWVNGERYAFMPLEDNKDEELNPLKPIKLDGFTIVKRHSGYFCDACGEFYEYAEPNQKDGTFKCWACRH